MSVNIYLNTVPESLKGATRILEHLPHHGNYWDGVEELKAIAKIQPVQGSASVFRDTLWHDGEELLGGEKYLLRTDIVFEREEPYDFDRILDVEEKKEKSTEIADKLLEGGNVDEADRWYQKAFELDYGNDGQV
jgi:hypothetical protein